MTSGISEKKSEKLKRETTRSMPWHPEPKYFDVFDLITLNEA